MPDCDVQNRSAGAFHSYAHEELALVIIATAIRSEVVGAHLGVRFVLRDRRDSLGHNRFTYFLNLDVNLQLVGAGSNKLRTSLFELLH